MIFQETNQGLKELNVCPFNLEKDLQNFVEKNMEQLFGYVFVDTEFIIEDYRFDSVAFDEESNAFVIFEYKRGKNESLVDQGYAYLNTLIKRKADFVLLYNEKLQKSRTKNDFDWSQTRIVFISPKFTQYQKDATSYGNMPFELYEITRYNGNLYDVDKINQQKTNKGGSVKIFDTLETDTMKNVNKEIRTYDEDYILFNATDVTKDMYFELKDRIQEIDPNILTGFTKNYVVFKKDKKHNIATLWLKRDYIEVVLHLKIGEIIDTKNITYDISNKGWPAAQYAFKFNNNIDIDDAIDLIKQSYKKINV